MRVFRKGGVSAASSSDEEAVSVPSMPLPSSFNRGKPGRVATTSGALDDDEDIAINVGIGISGKTSRVASLGSGIVSSNLFSTSSSSTSKIGGGIFPANSAAASSVGTSVAASSYYGSSSSDSRYSASALAALKAEQRTSDGRTRRGVGTAGDHGASGEGDAGTNPVIVAVDDDADADADDAEGSQNAAHAMARAATLAKAHREAVRMKGSMGAVSEAVENSSIHRRLMGGGGDGGWVGDGSKSVGRGSGGGVGVGGGGSLDGTTGNSSRHRRGGGSNLVDVGNDEEWDLTGRAAAASLSRAGGDGTTANSTHLRQSIQSLSSKSFKAGAESSSSFFPPSSTASDGSTLMAKAPSLSAWETGLLKRAIGNKGTTHSHEESPSFPASTSSSRTAKASSERHQEGDGDKYYSSTAPSSSILSSSSPFLPTALPDATPMVDSIAARLSNRLSLHRSAATAAGVKKEGAKTPQGSAYAPSAVGAGAHSSTAFVASRILRAKQELETQAASHNAYVSVFRFFEAWRSRATEHASLIAAMSDATISVASKAALLRRHRRLSDIHDQMEDAMQTEGAASVQKNAGETSMSSSSSSSSSATAHFRNTSLLGECRARLASLGLLHVGIDSAASTLSPSLAQYERLVSRTKEDRVAARCYRTAATMPIVRGSGSVASISLRECCQEAFSFALVTDPRREGEEEEGRSSAHSHTTPLNKSAYDDSEEDAVYLNESIAALVLAHGVVTSSLSSSSSSDGADAASGTTPSESAAHPIDSLLRCLDKWKKDAALSQAYVKCYVALALPPLLAPYVAHGSWRWTIDYLLQPMDGSGGGWAGGSNSAASTGDVDGMGAGNAAASSGTLLGTAASLPPPPPLQGLDEQAWFMPIWEFGEGSIAAPLSHHSTAVSSAVPSATAAAALYKEAAAENENIIPKVVQVGVVPFLCRALRHAYDPFSEASTKRAQAIAMEILAFNGDATSKATLMKPIMEAIEEAVADCLVPLITSAEASGGGGSGLLNDSSLRISEVTARCLFAAGDLLQNASSWGSSLLPKDFLHERCFDAIIRRCLAPIFEWLLSESSASTAALPSNAAAALAPRVAALLSLKQVLSFVLKSVSPESREWVQTAHLRSYAIRGKEALNAVLAGRQQMPGGTATTTTTAAPSLLSAVLFDDLLSGHW